MRPCSPDRLSRRDRRGYCQSGLSLIEMLVAVSVLGIALSMLYKSMGSSARATATLERQQNASLLAMSLLSARSAIPSSGWSEAGVSAGLSWQVSTVALAPPAETPKATPLHLVTIRIRPLTGDGGGEMVWTTLLPEALSVK